MRYNKSIIAVLILFISGLGAVQAQEDFNKFNRVQLSIGSAYTFHYNAPVTFVLCFEGCEAESQNALITPKAELSYYRTIFGHSELKMGIGYSQLGFKESVVEYFSFGKIDSWYRFNFLNLIAGYRFNFSQNPKGKPFVEANVIMDYRLSENGGDFSVRRNVNKKKNFSYQIKVGYLLSISNELDISVSGDFKTATKKYNEIYLFSGEEYIPYSYGLEVGLSKKF